MKTWLLLLALMLSTALAADKRILLIAGKPSHSPGEHEHNAGVRLLTKWLNTVPGIHATASYNGAWPPDDEFQKAAAIFWFADGAERHLAFEEGHPAVIAKAAARGAGLMFMHYATEPPAKRGHEEMLDWAGGYFEIDYTINPIWEANYTAFPQHPILRGVKPFRLRDEWYYNIRFRENRKGVTGLLVTTPPPQTIGADGIRSGNPDVRKKVGQPQTMSWAFVRPGGGRSVGFTGGHYHANLGDPNFRKVLLNGLLWVAKAKVPPGGVTVEVTAADLKADLDPKPPRRVN